MKKILSLLFAASNLCSAAKQPNILWLITDDHRADSIQAFNQATAGQRHSALGEVSSPSADKLASEGVLFTRAYCNSPGCAPSRTSMHFGMYPHHSGHYGFEKSHQQAAFSKPVLPQLMSGQGYQTALFGKPGVAVHQFDGKKYHLSEFYDTEVRMKDLVRAGHADWAKLSKWAKGKNLGDQVTWRFEDKPVSYFNPKSGPRTPEDEAKRKDVAQRLDICYASTREAASGLIIGGVSPSVTAKTTDGEILTAFQDYLQNAGKKYTTPWGHKKEGPGADKPLFTHLGFHFPHTPVMPSKEFRDQFAGKTYKIPDFSKEELKKLPPQLKTWFEKTNFADLKPEAKQQAIRDYYAFCAMGDSLVGKAVESFKDYSKKSGRDYLIIYVIGDHGWHLGEQGGESKFAPYDTSNHCAVIAVSSDKERWPAGKVCKNWIEFVDFAPTALQAAGAKLSEEKFAHLDGFPMHDTFTGTANRDYVLGEMNHSIGPRAYLRSDHFAFSMRPRVKNGKAGDKWGHEPGEGIKWGLTAPREAVELALFDLRNDPAEQNNVANDPNYQKLADWFRTKLGNIVLGDGRVECHWDTKEYHISDFAKGADDKKLNIPADLIPAVK